MNLNFSPISFGYKSNMKKVATEIHAHCAYGGEELNKKNPATAEHVHVHSRGGANNDSNYLPVCADHNQDRGNMPLNQYLKENPKAWDNIKKTILELKDVITDTFNGPVWAKQIKQAVEKETGKPLGINVFA